MPSGSNLGHYIMMRKLLRHVRLKIQEIDFERENAYEDEAIPVLMAQSSLMSMVLLLFLFRYMHVAY